MIKPGKKSKTWIQAKKKLIKRYLKEGITRCERCGGNWGLNFHHLDKRSRTGGGTHTFSATRLLCIECHDLVEYNKEENNKLRKTR